MKKGLIILLSLIIILGLIIIIKNNRMDNILTNRASPKSKIAVQKEVSILSGQYEYTAPNKLDKPSLVIAKKDGNIVWQKELVTPEVDPNLEKDVQLLKYFVTSIRSGRYDTIINGIQKYLEDALYVTLGNGKTYLLKIDTGDVFEVR